MINTYLNQRVTWQAKVGLDKYAKPTYSGGTVISARFVEKTATLKDANGKEFKADAEVWVLPSMAIKNDDLIIFSGQNYKAVQVDVRRDFNGDTHHRKVFVVRTKQ